MIPTSDQTYLDQDPASTPLCLPSINVEEKNHFIINITTKIPAGSVPSMSMNKHYYADM